MVVESQPVDLHNTIKIFYEILVHHPFILAGIVTLAAAFITASAALASSWVSGRFSRKNIILQIASSEKLKELEMQLHREIKKLEIDAQERLQSHIHSSTLKHEYAKMLIEDFLTSNKETQKAAYNFHATELLYNCTTYNEWSYFKSCITYTEILFDKKNPNAADLHTAYNELSRLLLAYVYEANGKTNNTLVGNYMAKTNGYCELILELTNRYLSHYAS